MYRLLIFASFLTLTNESKIILCLNGNPRIAAWLICVESFSILGGGGGGGASDANFNTCGGILQKCTYRHACAHTSMYIQSNFGRSNSPVSNTRDGSNSFVGPGNFPIHTMLKYTPGSNSDGSNSRTQKHGPQGDFSCKNAMMARTKYYLT